MRNQQETRKWLIETKMINSLDQGKCCLGINDRFISIINLLNKSLKIFAEKQSEVKALAVYFSQRIFLLLSIFIDHDLPGIHLSRWMNTDFLNHH